MQRPLQRDLFGHSPKAVRRTFALQPAPGRQWRRALARRGWLLLVVVAASVGCGWAALQCRQPEYEATAGVAVQTPAPLLRFASANALPQPPDPEAVATVAEELGSRATVAEALQRLGPAAVGLQAPPLRHPRWLLRWTQRSSRPCGGEIEAEEWSFPSGPIPSPGRNAGQSAHSADPGVARGRRPAGGGGGAAPGGDRPCLWPPQAAVPAARRRLHIVPMAQSRVLALSFTAPQPELAAAFLRQLISAYGSRVAERRRTQALARAHFVEAQALAAQAQLQAAEHGLERMATLRGLGDPAAELAAANQRWQQLSSAATSAQIAALEQADALAAGAPATPQPPLGELEGVPAALLVDRATLAAKIQSLAAQYRPQAAPLRQAQRQLAALDAGLAALRARRRHARQQALAAVQQQTVDLRQALARQRRSQTRLRAALAAFDLQQNQVVAQRTVYTSLLVQLHQALSAVGAGAAPIRVTDPALVPLQRLSPRWAPTLASALILGCLLGVAAVWLLDHADDALRWPEAEELGVPLAAVLPVRQERPRAAGAPADFARALDHGAAALLLAQAESGARVVQVTSAGVGEGKSLVASQLAQRLAALSPSVLLLDANFGRPARGQDCAGLVELLAGGAGVEQVLVRSPLSSAPSPTIIPAGGTAAASACLIAGGAAADLLTAARARFDWIVIDGPAGDDGPEAGLWASLADCNLVVAVFARTSRRRLRQVLDRLERAGGEGLAVVMNRVPAGAAPLDLELWRPQAAVVAPVEAAELRQRA